MTRIWPQGLTSINGAPSTDVARRRWAIAMALAPLAACQRHTPDTRPDTPMIVAAREFAKRFPRESGRAAFIEDAHQVERDYSTGLVRVAHRGRIYQFPANFVTPKGASYFKASTAGGEAVYEIHGEHEAVGGWRFFWPDLGGFTKDNWFDEFDHRIIDYKGLTLHLDKGSQRSTLDTLRYWQKMKSYESEPSVLIHGLKGYRWIGGGEYLWVGERVNGEPFMMSAAHPDDKAIWSKMPNPRCDVRLYNPDTGEETWYLFSLKWFKHWQDIDTRTSAKIASWRVA